MSLALRYRDDSHGVKVWRYVRLADVPAFAKHAEDMGHPSEPNSTIGEIIQIALPVLNRGEPISLVHIPREDYVHKDLWWKPA